MNLHDEAMANIEACILRLRNLGYKARVPSNPPGEMGEIYEVMGKSLVVRREGYAVAFSESGGITISRLLPGDALGLIDHFQSPMKNWFFISYKFENQSFFFSLEDDAFIDCVVHHVQEASEVVSALPSRLRPG